MLTNDNQFSMYLDKILIEKNLSGKTFASNLQFPKLATGVGKVSRWRRGLLLPPQKTLPLIAKALDIPLQTLTRHWMAVKYPRRASDLIVAEALGKIRVRLLLHFYEGDRFLGQTLPEIEVGSFDELQSAVIETYPGTKFNLRGINPKTSGANILVGLPSLQDGYGPNTTVRVMQVIPISLTGSIL